MTVSPPDAAPKPAGAGDAVAARRRLIDHAGPALHALALRIAGTAGDAQDVVEQTLLEAWRADRAGAAETSFAALARRCRDLALARSGKRAIGRIRRRPMDPHRVPPVALDLGVARAAVMRALADLEPAPRQAIELVGFEGYAVPDLGASTGKGRATRTDLRRAIAALPRLAPVIALLALGAPPAPLDARLRRRRLAAARRSARR